MKNRRHHFARWGTVFLFAAAMAWVEAAVVYYLRTMVDRIEPYQPNPLPMIGHLGPVELVREAATLIMLLTVGLLAGRTWRGRLGYAAIAFGVWDILYYVFLKFICGWPHSLLDWDILFLIPLPWWGPVLAPMCIAALMIAWGMLASRIESQSVPILPGGQQQLSPPYWKSWVLNFLGVALALYVFMIDALRVSGQGVEVVRNVLPTRFNWPAFCVGLLLMAAPAMRMRRELSLPAAADRNGDPTPEQCSPAKTELHQVK